MTGTILETVEKSALGLTPKATLANLEKAISATQEQLQALETRLETLEQAGEYAVIQADKLPEELGRLQASLNYYQSQLPAVKAKVEQQEKLDQREKSLLIVEKATVKIEKAVSDYNDARAVLLQCSRLLQSLDRELAYHLAQVKGMSSGSLYWSNNQFPESQEIAVLKIETDMGCPILQFLDQV